MASRTDDDVDFLYTLHGHGWSTALFFLHGAVVELPITHVFNDPCAVLMQALSDLLHGMADAEVLWWNEPGGTRLRLQVPKKQPHKVVVEIHSFYEDALKLPESEDGYRLLGAFKISLHHLLTLVYQQLRKLLVLLQEKEYAETRKKDFPFWEFQNFERLVLARLNLPATIC